MPRRRRPFAVLAAAALATSLTGCGTVASPSPATSATPTPAPTLQPTPTAGPTSSPEPAADVYARIRTAVERIRGLQPTKDVAPAVIDEQALRKNLEAEMDAERTPADFTRAEQLLIAMGLLPPGSSLRALTLDLQAGQVAGYYSPKKDELFVVSRSGSVGALEKATYAHEFTHQLQDQHFNLDGLGLDVPDQSDRALAVLGLVEGDAVSVQSTWMQTLTADELSELLGQSLDPAGLAALARAPLFLRETTLFPYQDGAAFVQSLLARGGYAAVNAAYASPPASTEQVLHPEKYASGEAPIKVAISADEQRVIPEDWTPSGSDTLGELTFRIWLRKGGLTATDARNGAAGWGGDRAYLYKGPNGVGHVVIITEWDDAGQASEFYGAAKRAFDALGLVGRVDRRSDATRVFIVLGPDAVDLEPVHFG